MLFLALSLLALNAIYAAALPLVKKDVDFGVDAGALNFAINIEDPDFKRRELEKRNIDFGVDAGALNFGINIEDPDFKKRELEKRQDASIGLGSNLLSNDVDVAIEDRAILDKREDVSAEAAGVLELAGDDVGVDANFEEAATDVEIEAELKADGIGIIFNRDVGDLEHRAKLEAREDVDAEVAGVVEVKEDVAAPLEERDESVHLGVSDGSLNYALTLEHLEDRAASLEEREDVGIDFNSILLNVGLDLAIEDRAILDKRDEVDAEIDGSELYIELNVPISVDKRDSLGLDLGVDESEGVSLDKRDGVDVGVDTGVINFALTLEHLESALDKREEVVDVHVAGVV